MEKLRWVTLGRQYDWAERAYLAEDAAPPLPAALSALAETVCQHVGLVEPFVRFEAAICNLYHAARRPSDRLGGHRDDVEPAASSPLVAVSLGLPCVFLLGGPSRRERPTPVLLRSGTALVMSGTARHAFHGVPTVLVPPALQPRKRGGQRRRAVGCESNVSVYRPWELTGVAAQAESAELEVAGHPIAAEGISLAAVGLTEEAALTKFLSRVRVSFSIRSLHG